MPKAKTFEFEVNQVPADSITVFVNVKYTRLFRFRMWLGTKLLFALGRLWDCNIEIVDHELINKFDR